MLDEAQMVHNTSSAAAVMASELWRVNGWCVTGTPISNSIHDLQGLLVFLDHDPYASDREFNHLYNTYTCGDSSALTKMRGLMASVVWRHSKAQVQHEFHLPPIADTSILVSIDGQERAIYEACERQNKDNAIRELRELVRWKTSYNPYGGPAPPYTGPRGLSLNPRVVSALQMLRQACSHPQLSKHNQMGIKSHERMSLSMLYELLLSKVEQKHFSELLSAVRELNRWADRRIMLKQSLTASGSPTAAAKKAEAEAAAHDDELIAKLKEALTHCATASHRIATNPLPDDAGERHGLSKAQHVQWIQLRFRTISALSVLLPSVAEQQETAMEQTRYRSEVVALIGSVPPAMHDNSGWRSAAVPTLRKDCLRFYEAANKADAEGRHLRNAVSTAKQQDEQKKAANAELARVNSHPAVVRKLSKRGTASDADAVNMATKATAEDDQANTCCICLDAYDSPVLTSCAHMFCSECITGHVQHGGGKNTCPLCRTELTADDILPIDPTASDPDEQAAAAEARADNADLLSECIGDWGTKISALVTDIKRQLRANPATFKAVVFSAWNQFIALIEKAFGENGIPFVTLLGSTDKRATSLDDFRKPINPADLAQPRIMLMSLKNREGAAGLTLTMADHVYLMEPCLNFGLEDQGVARIHRIGQTRPTKIVRIIVKDSIEEKLIRVQQRKRANVAHTIAQQTSEILDLFGISDTPQWFVDAFPEVYNPPAEGAVDLMAGDTDNEAD